MARQANRPVIVACMQCAGQALSELRHAQGTRGKHKEPGAKGWEQEAGARRLLVPARDCAGVHAAVCSRQPGCLGRSSCLEKSAWR